MAVMLGLMPVAASLGTAHAQVQYPTRPLRLLVPFAAGGTTDIVAREIGNALTRSLGAQVVVDNRPGASGAIAASLAAQAQPDGYTLLMASTAVLAISPHLHKALPYRADKDFVAISRIVDAVNLVVVHPSVPARSVNELLQLARSKPNEITFGSSGIGSVGHMALVQLGVLAGVHVLHVPYKGAQPAETDLVAGRINVMASGAVSALPHVKRGELRALAVTSATRAESLPDLPAVAESIPGFDVTAWFGLLAPAGTPPEVVTRLYREIVKALKDENLRRRFMNNGGQVVGSNPEAFSRYIETESVRYANLIKEGRIPID